MAPLIYFLALLVSALGLGAGMLLAFLAKEELDSIRKYLVLLKKLLLGGLLAIVGYIYSGGIGAGILFFFLGFGLGWFVHEDNMHYLILGAVFFVGSLSTVLFPLVATLILLYGFGAGTLLAHNHMKSKKVVWAIGAKKAIAAGGIYIVSAGAAYLLKYALNP